MIRCPDCAAELDVDEDEVEEGEILSCPECEAEMEVTQTHPVHVNVISDEDDIEEARWLRAYVGKTGFVQIGFPYQGTIFLYEVSTEWYDRYQRLVDAAEEFGGIVIDETDQDDEH